MFRLLPGQPVNSIVQKTWWMKSGYNLRSLQLPFLYFVYLFAGIPDGGHFIPYGRMWEGEGEKVKRGLVSSGVTAGYVFGMWNFLGGLGFFNVIFGPWLVMSFWLFMVTYLQHHSEDGKVYEGSSWSFVKGAFETVDRDYGEFWNELSHNMMDGHVLHHLFFEGVPHYNLKQGTEELKSFLKEEGMDIYKFEETEDFVGTIWKMWNEKWFFVEERNVVREE